MRPIIEKIAALYISFKSRRVLKRINAMLDFPVRSGEIKNVLVVMPRGLDHLDEASRFVQELRKHYRRWKIEIFDVDKIDKDNLNLLKIPGHSIVEKIKKGDYHLAIDLNQQFDIVSAFLTVMSEAAYRIGFTDQDQRYFNMQCCSAHAGNGFYYQALLDYVQKLFV